MQRWFHEHEDDTTEVEIDLRVGGTLRVVTRDPVKDVEYGASGQYTEIDPPRRLAFTWLWDHSATRTLIEVDFEESDGITSPRAPRGRRPTPPRTRLAACSS